MGNTLAVCVSSVKEMRKRMEFEIDIFFVYWVYQLLIFLLSLERAECYFPLHVQYGELEINESRQS
jgi:hypothetical protein